MKKIILLLLCVLLTSCSAPEEKKDYFLEPHELYVTFASGEISINGILKTSPKQIIFYPDIPKGLSVTVNSDGSEVRFGDLVFGDSVAKFTRLVPFYEQMTEGSLTTVFNGKKYPEKIEGKEFKITVHKEICK